MNPDLINEDYSEGKLHGEMEKNLQWISQIDSMITEYKNARSLSDGGNWDEAAMYSAYIFALEKLKSEMK